MNNDIDWLLFDPRKNYELIIYPYTLQNNIGIINKNIIQHILSKFKKVGTYHTTEYQYKNLKLIMIKNNKEIYKYQPSQCISFQKICMQINNAEKLPNESFPYITEYNSINEYTVDIYENTYDKEIEILHMHNSKSNYIKIYINGQQINNLKKIINSVVISL